MYLKLISLSLLLLIIGCQNRNNMQNEETIKKEIINTLKNETKYFCDRNLEAWQAQWAKQPFTYKMYAGEGRFEEFVGWEAINQFTVQHIAANPAPIPLPNTNFDVDIQLLGKTAWVLYAKMVDSVSVRETRFMVEENGQWKIARMQTVY